MLGSGTYQGLTVSGVCIVLDGVNVTVRGGVTLQPGSTLMAISSNTMDITGTVTVGKGAVLALGCSAEMAEMGCDGLSADTVRGGIVANGAKAMYLNGDTIHGTVSFVGGGWGPGCFDDGSLGHQLVVKDNDFHGSVNLSGWTGCWMGFIRNTVHGTVTISGNYANQDAEANPQGPDSTEVVANQIWGQLSCSGNTPMAQIGDANEGAPPGYGPNIVHGRATGECATLVA
jgi:hypothetical protein